ncbi:MAG: hypothetical protein LUC50_06460 [Ruminococcus sp.]|nr:hypothetical protein [Ruminococcus sp.]
MERSMYSLILMDDVVAVIDVLAQQQGTSRSNYINQILAEHVGYLTPEKQMQQVFSCVAQQMDKEFRVQEQGSDAMLLIFGALRYKYRPTIRYRVELTRDQRDQTAGYLKISCRTQSQPFLQVMQSFFQFWVQMEQRLNPDGTDVLNLYQIEDGRMIRVLMRRDFADDAAFGAAVGNFIRTFHAVLQSYVTGLQQELPAVILQHVLQQQYLAAREHNRPNL